MQVMRQLGEKSVAILNTKNRQIDAIPSITTRLLPRYVVKILTEICQNQRTTP